MRGRYYFFIFFFFNRDFAQRKKCSLHVKTDEDLHIERKTEPNNAEEMCSV